MGYSVLSLGLLVYFICVVIGFFWSHRLLAVLQAISALVIVVALLLKL
jgi:flagellar motor component MotA